MGFTGSDDKDRRARPDDRLATNGLVNAALVIMVVAIVTVLTSCNQMLYPVWCSGIRGLPSISIPTPRLQCISPKTLQESAMR